MSILSARNFYAVALCAVASYGLSLPALAGGGENCKEKMTRMDAEGGSAGQISASEHAAQANKRFDSMDVNKDGRIAAAEIEASHGAESAAWAKHRVSSIEKIKQLDSNNDGALTRAEYAAGSQKMFEKLDIDSDGTLTAAEMHVESMTAHDVE
jgi:Ca2+-binding EF-hand superfamily protein